MIFVIFKMADGRHFEKKSVESSYLCNRVIDLSWRNFLSLEFGAKFQRKLPLFLKVPKFPISSSVSIELQLVTDRQTQRHRAIASTSASIASSW